MDYFNNTDGSLVEFAEISTTKPTIELTYKDDDDIPAVQLIPTPSGDFRDDNSNFYQFDKNNEWVVIEDVDQNGAAYEVISIIDLKTNDVIFDRDIISLVLDMNNRS